MLKREVVVIGGGPSGMAAAIEAAQKGAGVLVIDANAKAGGQLFKQIHKFFGSSEHRAGVRGIDIGEELLRQAEQLGVEVWLNSVVMGLFDHKTVAVERGQDDQKKKLVSLQAEKMILACGASENVISFKGWTLPGVMGAGAAQTMVNTHRVLPGRKALMIGSGNVGLIVAYQLLQAGADVAAVVEAALSIGGYAVHAAKLTRAGVPILTRHTILEARGDRMVEEAVVAAVDEKWQPLAGTEQIFDVDAIAIAAGLKPLVELAVMQGCKTEFCHLLGGWVPLHDHNMESTVPGLYVVGDLAGIEEANTALEEGRLAGVAAAEALGKIGPREAELEKDKIWSRLNGLRLGPHGSGRAEAKRALMENYTRQTG